MGLFLGLKEKIHGEYSQQYLAHRQNSVHMLAIIDAPPSKDLTQTRTRLEGWESEGGS